ncbi:shikimate dehydrogenase [Pelagibius marinus]|uniref:shikimate dehydrogenase n=1 Tax=Pelagibius marinus TaxID=2762760 RepID=UPI0018725801|nr:shikimate dehydrogenase [Pelagibius marinus]
MTVSLPPLSGKAKVAGLIGWPVSHSRSPRLHGYWLAEHGIDGAYVPLPVQPARVEVAVRGLAAAGLRGVNVTIPHKQTVLGLCDEVDDIARRIGAVNLLTFDGEKISGTNTDSFGFMENLKAGAPGYDATRAPAVLLGAGGGARAVAVGLLDAGVPELRLCNRNRERAEGLAADLGNAVTVCAWEERCAALDGAGLLVNSTSLGMSGQPALEMSLGDLEAGAVVADLVYSPLETALLAEARAKGCTAVDGLGMLLHQGRPCFAAWFGTDPQVTPQLRAYVLSGD